MSEELKPCICGAEAEHIGDTGFVWCQNPHCQLHIRNEFTAGWWNTRPIEDALRAELVRKDEVISVLKEVIAAADAEGLRGLQRRVNAAVRLKELKKGEITW